MKGFGEQNKSPKKQIRNKNTKPSKEQIINQAFQYQSEGNTSEAVKSYRYLINLGLNDPIVYANYGSILKDLGRLEEAELSIKNAIKHNPNFVQAYYVLASILQDQDKLEEAELSYRSAIRLKPDIAEAHSNLGTILRNIGKLEEAELSYRNAIKLKPDAAQLHFNYGSILKDLGRLEEAELSIRNAIKLNPDFARAYFSLSTLKYSLKDKKWQDRLFSKDILKHKLKIEKIDIYYARANIFHKEKNYTKSTEYLRLANNLQLELNPSNSNYLIKKSKDLLIESDQKVINKTQKGNHSESIFIVGMPRCGSTLLESILSINKNVIDLGEINLLEKAFIKRKKIDREQSLDEIYFQEINTLKGKFKITTNKWLYNYQYAGIIASQIPNAKIIHCFRNPLDNILSITRANFARGNAYSSSIVDCVKVYLDQEEIMKKYKENFRSKIYDFDYDSLVCNPKQKIEPLINWLGWEWNNSYLSPHLNKRSVLTASNVEIRSPINSKSIGGWQNYKDMLKPAIEILRKTNRYCDLIS